MASALLTHGLKKFRDGAFHHLRAQGDFSSLGDEVAEESF